jgi:hypothetical protein
VGDAIEDCHSVVYSDADFAGDTHESKSTSGCFVAVVGPNAFAPVSALCKTQSCVAHSSTESEIIALDHTMRNEGIPILGFLQCLASGGKDEGVRGNSHIHNDHRFNVMADDKGAGGNPSNKSKPKNIPRLVVFEDNEAVIKKPSSREGAWRFDMFLELIVCRSIGAMKCSVTPIFTFDTSTLKNRLRT